MELFYHFQSADNQAPWGRGYESSNAPSRSILEGVGNQ